jgi:hypothetical protein
MFKPVRYAYFFPYVIALSHLYHLTTAVRRGWERERTDTVSHRLQAR